MALSRFMQKLEVKPTDDEYESITTSRWGNRDVYPVAHDKRTYGVKRWPQSAGITTPGLIGFVLFICLYFPIIYFIPAHKIQKLLEVQMNGGSPGNLVSSQLKLTKAEVGFRVMQGITSVAGTYTGGTDRVSDWTRYGRSRHTSTPAILALFLTVILTALIGILSTSALIQVYGEAQWNPLLSLQSVQATTYTPACRAGTFFAGLGLLSVTVFVNYTQNCVSSGMDIAMLVPKYFSQRRGAIVFSILGVLAQPWRFLTGSATFITVLSSFGVFMSPAAAILIVDFWIIRGTKWNIPELYKPNGIYWFTFGVNWRAMLAYLIGMWPALPGFVAEVGGTEIAITWRRFYQISYFIGFIISGGLFWAFNLLSPVPGRGVQVDFDLDGTVVVVEGVEKEHGEGEGFGDEKGLEAFERKV
ncbi:putative Nicotinamide riboside transporter 1 [Glarea lozoyensis 74030]|uniref:Putative Nicotinamide riboside transporter 1 n=1 Tax=Glarea lozoyensis (strain ATCC 74030 / MF5533) TaxID=1104152 RepID=H0EQ70_GLAL7|nr:putative Nicotinamide riboside transporter 1 [Glarea lozoyensis 74030]